MFWKKKPPPKIFDYLIVRIPPKIYLDVRYDILTGLGLFGYELFSISQSDQKSNHELIFKRESDGTAEVPMKYIDQIEHLGVVVFYGQKFKDIPPKDPY